MKFIKLIVVGLCLCSISFADEAGGLAGPESVLPGPPPGIVYNSLSQEDKELLRKGEISQAQLLAGGFLGTFIGFGSGHLPYEMYGSRGWIFTTGEVGTLALAILGATGVNNDCTVQSSGFRKCEDVGGSKEALVFGLLGFVGLRIWEIIDVWTIPSTRNYEVRRVRQKMGRELTYSNWTILPTFRAASGLNPASTGIKFTLNF